MSMSPFELSTGAWHCQNNPLAVRVQFHSESKHTLQNVLNQDTKFWSTFCCSAMSHLRWAEFTNMWEKNGFNSETFLKSVEPAVLVTDFFVVQQWSQYVVPGEKKRMCILFWQEKCGTHVRFWIFHCFCKILEMFEFTRTYSGHHILYLYGTPLWSWEIQGEKRYFCIWFLGLQAERDKWSLYHDLELYKLSGISDLMFGTATSGCHFQCSILRNWWKCL